MYEYLLRGDKNDYNIFYIDAISECLNRKFINYVIRIPNPALSLGGQASWEWQKHLILQKIYFLKIIAYNLFSHYLL